MWFNSRGHSTWITRSTLISLKMKEKKEDKRGVNRRDGVSVCLSFCCQAMTLTSPSSVFTLLPAVPSVLFLFRDEVRVKLQGRETKLSTLMTGHEFLSIPLKFCLNESLYHFKSWTFLLFLGERNVGSFICKFLFCSKSIVSCLTLLFPLSMYKLDSPFLCYIVLKEGSTVNVEVDNKRRQLKLSAEKRNTLWGQERKTL